MRVVGIDSVIFGVEDMDAGIRFWTDFGLAEVSKDGRKVLFSTAEGAIVVVRPHDDPGLPPAPVAGSTVREVIWGVAAPEVLDQIESALEPDFEARRDADGGVHTVDPSGYAVGFRVGTVKEVEVERTGYNAPGSAGRVDAPAPLYEKATPVHLAHVVFLAPDLEETSAFYQDRLGFKLTDSYPGNGRFLRAGESHDHHNLFLLRRDDARGFHHIAFDVRDLHEVFGGGLHMNQRGWETHIGPGRHPISSAYFWYFRNPCGGAAEYDFDTDVVTDAWQPREFEPGPDTFAEWALEGGIERYMGVQTTRT